MKDKILVFQSDFGLNEGTVSQMYGVASKVDPALRMYDITHNIPRPALKYLKQNEYYRMIPVLPIKTVNDLQIQVPLL